MSLHSRVPFRSALLGASLAAALQCLPRVVAAQYFGRNKVQYEDFDFHVLHTPHFDIHFYPEEEQPVRDAGRMAERWNTRFTGEFAHPLTARKPMIIYANQPDFQQTNVIQGMLEEGTGGVTEALRNRVVLPLTGVYADNDHVIGHELVHVFQYDIAESSPGTGLQAIGRLPLWLIEGMAEYLSIGRDDPLTAMWLRDALARDNLPTIDQLTKDPRFFPYRYGEALWAYIGGRWGDAMVPQVFRNALRMGWDPALVRTLGVSSDQLSKDWIASIRETYGAVLTGRTPPAQVGVTLQAGARGKEEMNVSPVVSPDGRYVAFFSSRGLFGIDLYLADAADGHIIKKLASPTTDTHFDAVSFIYSSGAWSPDARKFAYVVYSEGDNQIAILDVASGGVERTIAPAGVGAITTVSWSPDGRQLAFSGTAGGVSDLFLYDLQSNQLKRLTNDRYADLQPAWSPDGRTLAFATDRGPGTDFDALTYAAMRIATMDVASGQITVLPLFTGAKQINPQFSADGASIYFVSDHDGVDDLFRVSLATGQLYRVTHVTTGVSGITALSPAISVASRTGRVVFSVFDAQGYALHGIDAADAMGEPVTTTAPTASLAGVLPPVEAHEGYVMAYLHDPLRGLPPNGDFPVTDYHPSLSLEAVGNPSVGVATGPFGTGVGGGASFLFGDMLGNRTLAAAVQANGSFKDIGGQLFFLNAAHRWNWFAEATHLPYLTGQATVRPTTVDIGGQTVAATQYDQILQRIYIDELGGGAQYPFSTTRRFELNATARYYHYNFQTDRAIVVGNQVVDERVEDIPAPPGVTLAETNAALVGDNSFFGFTSPVSGGRFRIQGGATFGSLTFGTALLDARRYFFARPFTFAFRALHYGRYGAGGEDPRLSPLIVGDPQLVRGYEPSSFSASECADGGDTLACPAFDRLIGSRVAVFNAEFRIPLFGTRGFGLINFPYFPTEIAPFFDAGVAWTSHSTPDLTFARRTTERVPVFSAGVSARVNLFGYLIGEAYYARPFQRPDVHGGVWGFQLAPGW